MRAFLSVVVLLLLFGAEACAFSPGPTIIRECPKCRVPFEQPTMASGNTFGARFWSDGKMQAPMLPDYPWLVKCPKCKHLFWIEDAKKLGDTHGGWRGRGKLEPLELATPTVSDFYHILRSTNVKRKQIYIRTHLWHCANDSYRNRAAAEAKLSATAKANITALSGLMTEKYPDDRLTKAEIARELGQFDKCLKLLNIHFSERLSATACAIKMLAQEKYAPVLEFTEQGRLQTRALTAEAKPTAIETKLFARSMRESCVFVANGMLARYGIDALLHSDPKQLKSAIAAGAAKGDDNAVAAVMDAAVVRGSVVAVQFLLDSGARVNGAYNSEHITPLITACLCLEESVAKLLIERGANVNVESEWLNPLNIACRNRDITLAKLLIDSGAKIERGDGKESPLMCTCAYTYDRPYNISKVDWAKRTIEMAELLIENGANVNGGDSAGSASSTPLIEICRREFSQDKYAIERYTPAEKAACLPIYLNIIRLLLDNKADVNRCDYNGESALLCACAAGNLDAVKLLLDRGADVNKASKDGATPLSAANRLPDKTIAQLLVEHGAKPNTGK